MQPRSEFPVLPAAQATRATPAFLGSALLHGILVLVAVVGSRDDRKREQGDAMAAPAQVRMVELPAYVPERRRPPERERPSDPVPVRRVPRPQVVRGPEMPEEVTVRNEPAAQPERPPVAAAPEPPAASPEPQQPAAPVDLAAVRAAEMRSEAERLFGPRRLGSTRPPGPVSASWVNQLTDDRDNDCTPRERPPRDPSEPPELGTVSGRVFRAGTSQPLPGAYLQILGTPYATFADDEGAYTLEFDRSLVDDCRTQYVQVSKDGFAPQRLILSLGSRTSNDIPLQRR
jgi:hypothetical protein